MNTYMSESFSKDLKKTISSRFRVLAWSFPLGFMVYALLWCCPSLKQSINYVPSLESLLLTLFVLFTISGIGIFVLITLTMDHDYNLFSLNESMERIVVSFFVSSASSPFWFWLYFMTTPRSLLEGLIITALSSLAILFAFILLLELIFFRKIEKQKKESPIQLTKGETELMASKPTYEGIKELSDFSLHSVPKNIQDDFQEMKESLKILASRISKDSSAEWDELEQQCVYTREALLLYYRMAPKNRPLTEENIKNILTQLLTNVDNFLLRMDKKSIGRIQEVHTYMTENE